MRRSPRHGRAVAAHPHILALSAPLAASSRDHEPQPIAQLLACHRQRSYRLTGLRIRERGLNRRARRGVLQGRNAKGRDRAEPAATRTSSDKRRYILANARYGKREMESRRGGVRRLVRAPSWRWAKSGESIVFRAGPAGNRRPRVARKPFRHWMRVLSSVRSAVCRRGFLVGLVLAIGRQVARPVRIGGLRARGRRRRGGGASWRPRADTLENRRARLGVMHRPQAAPGAYYSVDRALAVVRLAARGGAQRLAGI